MTIYRVETLEGGLLDWAVAKAEGMVESEDPERGGPCFMSPDGSWVWCWKWEPSINWEQGGPIIQRERITIHQDNGQGCRAYVDAEFEGTGKAIYSHRGSAHGPTPLVACMRAFVSSKLGNEVDL